MMGDRATVIALHCSGAGASEWRELGAALGPCYELVTPEHYGSDGVGPWTGYHAFTLADEAARTVAIVDRCPGEVHLVGHSYGGAVALRVANERPRRVTSLTLYEPCAFHLLEGEGARGALALAEIASLSRRIDEGVLTGRYLEASRAFVDYWGGSGAWAALRPSAQASLTRWLPKAPLDFRATMAAPGPGRPYSAVRAAALILRGEHAPAPTRLIADALATMLSRARVVVMDGAGHMGPMTHATHVNARIARHVADCDARCAQTPAAAVRDDALALG